MTELFPKAGGKAPTVHPAVIPGYNLNRVETLVVERNPMMRKALGGVLKTLGMKQVRLAENEDEALWLQSEKPADLVFTDWAPGLDGVKLVKTMRRGARDIDPFVPIIMMTAQTEEHRVFQARDAGMTELLAKPFSPTLIYQRICSVIERPRPFIRCKSFFGPDRRRRLMAFLGADRRAKGRRQKLVSLHRGQPSDARVFDALRQALTEEAKRDDLK